MSSCSSIDDPSLDATLATPRTSEFEAHGDPALDWVSRFNDPDLFRVAYEALALREQISQIEPTLAKARDHHTTAENILLGEMNIKLPFGNEQGPALIMPWEKGVWERIEQQGEASPTYTSDADFLRLALASKAVWYWIAASEAKLQLDLAKQMVTNLEQTVRAYEARASIKKATQTEVSIAREALSDIRRSSERFQHALREAIAALNILTGYDTRALLQSVVILTPPPPAPPAGISSGLLYRRPDINSASQQVGAAFGRPNISMALELPEIPLTGLKGDSSPQLQKLLRDPEPRWNLPFELLEPLLVSGVTEREVALASPSQHRVVGAARETSVEAFSDVEKALFTEGILRSGFATMEEAADILETRVDELTDGLRDMKTDALTLLKTERDMIRARRRALRTHRNLLLTRIHLHLVLSGDYSDKPYPISQ